MTYPDPATLASIERCTESGHPCGCTQTRRLSAAPRWRLCSYHEGYEDGTERALTPDDERALHIGRAVMASQPNSTAIHSFFTKVVSVDLTAVGWNNARAEFLAAGEVEG